GPYGRRRISVSRAQGSDLPPRRGPETGLSECVEVALERLLPPAARGDLLLEPDDLLLEPGLLLLARILELRVELLRGLVVAVDRRADDLDVLRREAREDHRVERRAVELGDDR